MCIFALAGAAGAAGGLGSAMTALGGVVSAIGSIAAGQAQAASYENAAKVAEYNAKVAENSAQAEQQRAAYDAGMIDEDRKRLVGLQRAGGASAGLDIAQGTPVAVLGDTSRSSELDILARKYAGDAQATALRNDATRFRAEGDMARSNARSARTAGIIGGFSSLLSSFDARSSRSRPYQPLRAS